MKVVMLRAWVIRFCFEPPAFPEDVGDSFRRYSFIPLMTFQLPHLHRRLIAGLFLPLVLQAATYYVHPGHGDDGNPGTTASAPFGSLAAVTQLDLAPGDEIRLAAGTTLPGSLVLPNLAGTAEAPIRIGSYGGASADGPTSRKAVIDARGRANGVWLSNPRHVILENLIITAAGGGLTDEAESGSEMRCGVLVTSDVAGEWGYVTLAGLEIRDVFFEEPGFRRGEDEVRTANGSQSYGWGVRFINRAPDSTLQGVTVRDSVIENVSHTGLKYTTPFAGITDVKVLNNVVQSTGGPGIQMSGVERAHVSGNRVDRSGSGDDSRKWSRGSGLWTWSCTDVLIEHNTFTNASGPGDSAGCHIDYNCYNVVVQYNLSARNAGGFVEILGNNHNCAYRYNVSVDDGHRVKGENGAFQEGKSFWLSGYVGPKEKRTGPFNSYIYNNTVYVREDIVAKVSVAASAEGVLVANNIFYWVGPSRDVVGDQSRGQQGAVNPILRTIFANNLFLRQDTWPAGVAMQDTAPLVGDPQFANPGGLDLRDYLPGNHALIKDAGVEIEHLPEDDLGLVLGLKVSHDILGQPVWGKPDLGAIEVP